MRNKYLSIALLFLYLSGFTCLSFAIGQSLPESKTRAWLNQTVGFALTKVADNISPVDGSPGAVIAARSRSNPDYYYHWVRDAALAIDSMIDIYKSSTNKKQKELIRKKVFEYLDFSTRIQNVTTQTDLGEPKFNVNGSVYNDPWARPQNDGPALRAISLIHWARILIANGEDAVVKEKMYEARLPAASPIKKDLEYVSHHWKDASFDIWEEVRGTHFYTLMVARRAMLEGAAFASQLGDDGAARWYSLQGKEIELELQQFWDPARGYFVATLNRDGGIDYKESNLDSSVLLGLLHGDMHDGFLSWDDPRVTVTIQKVIQIFSEIYPINHRTEIPGVAIGRYPEDRYSGTDFTGGNPWPICTLAVAESLYRYAATVAVKGNVQAAQEISDYADLFVERVRYHAYKDGSLSEQMNRYTGYMQSASDLTWNYAALLTTRTSVLKLSGNNGT